jgi:N utilization substance protein B
MQALCQWEVQHDESSAGLDAFLLDQSAEHGGAGYAGEIVQSFWAQRDLVDRLIGTAAERWTLNRISPVERNVMRVALVEMLSGQVPPKVAVDEAIEIGREFGAADSPRFVNGVLDKVLRNLPSPDGENG